MNVHSAGVTGVIDRRFPGLRVRMPASAAWARRSARCTNGVFSTSRMSTLTQRGASRFDAGS
jgi:hypothetical protein